MLFCKQFSVFSLSLSFASFLILCVEVSVTKLMAVYLSHVLFSQANRYAMWARVSEHDPIWHSYLCPHCPMRYYCTCELECEPNCKLRHNTAEVRNDSKQTNASFMKICVHTYNDSIQGLLTLDRHKVCDKAKCETEQQEERRCRFRWQNFSIQRMQSTQRTMKHVCGVCIRTIASDLV